MLIVLKSKARCGEGREVDVIEIDVDGEKLYLCPVCGLIYMFRSLARQCMEVHEKFKSSPTLNRLACGFSIVRSVEDRKAVLEVFIVKDSGKTVSKSIEIELFRVGPVTLNYIFNNKFFNQLESEYVFGLNIVKKYRCIVD